MDASSLAFGFFLGLSLAAPPGPMNALIASHATRNGFSRAVRVGVAAPIVDTFYLVLVAFGLTKLVDVTPYLGWLAVVGGALMMFFAWQVVRIRPDAAPTSLPGFQTMAWLSLTNPLQIGWWLTLGTASLASEGLLWAAGFLVAIFGWVVVFAFLMAHGARRWAWFEPLTLVLSADVMVAFGLFFWVKAGA